MHYSECSISFLDPIVTPPIPSLVMGDGNADDETDAENEPVSYASASHFQWSIPTPKSNISQMNMFFVESNSLKLLKIQVEGELNEPRSCEEMLDMPSIMVDIFCTVENTKTKTQLLTTNGLTTLPLNISTTSRLTTETSKFNSLTPIISTSTLTQVRSEELEKTTTTIQYGTFSLNLSVNNEVSLSNNSRSTGKRPGKTNNGRSKNGTGKGRSKTNNGKSKNGSSKGRRKTGNRWSKNGTSKGRSKTSNRWSKNSTSKGRRKINNGKNKNGSGKRRGRTGNGKSRNNTKNGKRNSKKRRK
ncbi:hypothetical protein SNEBB_005196 [Seison nebaliae]|nr:hypothetical protein SNEBB_005196 [Seison nebaliae]